MEIPKPDKNKLSPENPYYEEILRRHEEAFKKEEAFYVDPETGFTVLTAYYLEKRGYCCGNGCRHCPF
jgi:hypothetical protein